MYSYDIKWRITEKNVHTEVQGYPDVLYNVGYECLGSLCVLDESSGLETWYTDSLSGNINIPLVTESENFIPLYQLEDQTILDWISQNGISLVDIENQIKANLDNLASGK